MFDSEATQAMDMGGIIMKAHANLTAEKHNGS